MKLPPGKRQPRVNAREVTVWELREDTINLTAKLDALDAKYVNATIGQIASILHTTPEYAQVAIDILPSRSATQSTTMWRRSIERPSQACSNGCSPGEGLEGA